MNSYIPLPTGHNPLLSATLQTLPADPLLGLSELYRQDPNANKIDLGVGVYKDDAGRAQIMAAVKAAEQRWLAQEDSKAYIAPGGDDEFIQAMANLLLGAENAALADSRLSAIQTPGGSGALRIAAEFILRCNPHATLWLPDPTWVNHEPLLSRAGLTLQTYPYYDHHNHCLDIEALLETLRQVPQGDVVLLHGCCHNPSGADLTPENWQQIAEIAQARGFTPLVDIAYQGYADGLEQDAAGLRLLVDQLPEVLITASCSKNFALYRERVGLFGVISPNWTQAAICQSQALDIVRGYYFVPPAHGAYVVKTLLADSALTLQWQSELETIRQRIQNARELFVAASARLGLEDRFGHIARQKGMFSFLGLTEHQVDYLRRHHSVYMASSSRINLSGINASNLDNLMQALQATIYVQ